MAWDEVPAKLAQYSTELYAPEFAATKLLTAYGAGSVDQVPEQRREEFEAALDHRLGACINLRTSRAVRPT